MVKHEAMAVRRSRLRLVACEDDELERQEPAHEPVPQERMEAFERVSHAAEALRRLKPQEMTALLLKAQGLSYAEIATRQGWTYTKVNRCLTEGRRSFRQRLAAIEEGSECERWSAALSAMADGEASAQQIAEVRPHLRNCAACRATLRDFRVAPREVAALVPVGVLALAEAGGGSWVARLCELVTGGLPERLLLSAQKAQGLVEAGSTAKVAAVAASATALAGGVAVERAAEHPRPAPAVAAHVGRERATGALRAGAAATAGGWSAREAAGESAGARAARRPAPIDEAAARARARGDAGAATRAPKTAARGWVGAGARGAASDELGVESAAAGAHVEPVTALRATRPPAASRVSSTSASAGEFGGAGGSASTRSAANGTATSATGGSPRTTAPVSSGARSDSHTSSSSGDEFGM